MPAHKLSEFLVGQDMYGQPVSVLYRGSDFYRTKVGAFFTMATYALMLFNLAALLQGFFDGSRQKQSQNSGFFDRFDAGALKFDEHRFNVRIPKPMDFTEDIGRFRMSKWTIQFKDEQGLVDDYEELRLQVCEQDEIRKYWNFFTSRGIELDPEKNTLMCPEDAKLYLESEPSYI